MNREKLYGLIKKEALKHAEEELRHDREYQGLEKRPTDTKVLNPDWHPYFARITRSSHGIRFALVVRDGEYDYFRKNKQAIPDFQTPAMRGITKALEKYRTELTAVYLTELFNKTEGVTAEWRT